jgi:hypothetical protein
MLLHCAGVQVMALWGEHPDWMFARLRRFYRPSETLPALDGPRKLFRSDQVDDRIPLSVVLRKCIVTVPPPAGGQGAAAAAGQGQDAAGLEDAYVCVGQLDLEEMRVGLLPPDCDIPLGGVEEH